MIIMNNKKKNFVGQVAGGSEGEGGEGRLLRACVEELIQAVHAHDVEGAEQALRSCFLELQGAPEEPEY